MPRERDQALHLARHSCPSSPRIPVSVGGEEACRVELASNGSVRQAQNRAAAWKRSRHAPAIPARMSTGHLSYTQRTTVSLFLLCARNHGRTTWIAFQLTAMEARYLLSGRCVMGRWAIAAAGQPGVPRVALAHAGARVAVCNDRPAAVDQASAQRPLGPPCPARKPRTPTVDVSGSARRGRHRWRRPAPTSGVDVVSFPVRGWTVNEMPSAPDLYCPLDWNCTA